MVRSAVILAAGKGTRMKSKLPKVLHKVLGTSMVEHVISTLKAAQIENIVVVLGHESQQVEDALKHLDNVSFVYQTEQLGTAHALLQAKDRLQGIAGNTIVVCGDTPLLRTSTIEQMFTEHERQNNYCTILSGIVDDATGYGRIVRNENQQVIAIVEQKDATPAQQQIKEFNSGTYCFKNEQLFELLGQISNNNAQGEYYLPDMIELYNKQQQAVSAYVLEDMSEIIGVNDRIALAEVEQILKLRINQYWQVQGVTIINPDNTYIGTEVQLENDVIIEPNVQLLGKTTIGCGAYIGANSTIDNSTVGAETKILQSYITESVVGAHTTIGPFAHIRMHTAVGDNVRVGNFVEIKNSVIGNKTATAHLTYIGDSDVGEKVNFGCGTITVNYDGFTKSRTTISDNVFIGCNSNLIAPVSLGTNSYIAAGTTVTMDVPDDALAVGRARQENKLGYARILKEKIQNK